MRILHLTNLIGQGGIESYVKALSLEQIRGGHEVGIIICLSSSFDLSEIRKFLNSHGIVTFFINAASGHDYRLPFKTYKAIQGFKPDLIHLSSMPILASIALLAVNVPKILTLHLMDENTITNRILFCTFNKVVDGVIAVSDSLLGYHTSQRHFPRKKWVRVYNGIQLENYNVSEMSFPERHEEFVLTMTCRMEKDKHVGDAIRALALARKFCPDLPFRLLLLGNGSEIPSLQKLAIDLEISDCVDFLGYQKDVRPFLQRAHGHLVLSEKETFSISALEAMACGIPVISYPVSGGFHELHKSELTGVVTRDRSPETLATSLLRLASQNSSWSFYKQESAEVASKFSMEKTQSDTMKFYKYILFSKYHKEDQLDAR